MAEHRFRHHTKQEAMMAPDPMNPVGHNSSSETGLRGGMSLFTMLMTVPQVLTIWVGHQAAGVSVVSWSAYLLSAILWFWYGLQKRDKNIYLPCIGWAGLDTAVIVGAVIYA
jgi:uncharacterized protein with PQ loop repeat